MNNKTLQLIGVKKYFSCLFQKNGKILNIHKVEIFLEQRQVAFLSPSKFCRVIRTQPLSVLKIFLLYLQQYFTKCLEKPGYQEIVYSNGFFMLFVQPTNRQCAEMSLFMNLTCGIKWPLASSFRRKTLVTQYTHQDSKFIESAVAKRTLRGHLFSKIVFTGLQQAVQTLLLLKLFRVFHQKCHKD